MSSPRKILALKLRSMGDTILMTAPLLELRRAFPDAEIHVGVMAAWAPLLEKHPAVDRIWTYERRPEATSRAKTVARLAMQLRRERFDWVVNFHASPSSALIAFATGAKKRSIHFHGHRDRNRYSTVAIPDKGVLKPIIERDMDALRALSLHVPAGREPKIFLDPAEIESARADLNQRGLSGRLLTLGLGASRPSKTWPLDRFAALALDWIRSEKNASALALTGPGEENLAKAFLQEIDDLLQETIADSQERSKCRARIQVLQAPPLRRLASILSLSTVFAGNDSGPKHLAVAVGTPSVTLFGPEHPLEWHPYSTDRHPYFFIEGLSCRRDAQPGMPAWCGVDHCITEQHRCMTGTGVDAVFQKAREVAKP